MTTVQIVGCPTCGQLHDPAVCCDCRDDHDSDYCCQCGHFHTGDCPIGPCSDYRCCH